MWCVVFSVILLYVSSGKTFEDFTDDVLQYRSNTGEPCEWEGKNGTCINFWNCFTNAIDAAVYNKHPPVCKTENGEVLACCTSCFTIANISSIIIVKEHGLMLKRTGKKATDKCIEYMNLGGYGCLLDLMPGTVGKDYNEGKKCYVYFQAGWLTSGGEDADREEYPHMALLGYGGNKSSADWLCGGTIISKRYILTAAHCRTTSILGDVKYAALGILKKSDPRELWNVYKVDRFIPHPDYHPPSSYHDIALIRTKTRIIFSNAVLPACLPEDDNNTEKGVATGWGALGHRQKSSDVLQKVALSRFNKEDCSLHYTPYRNLPSGYNHTTQMCYGDANIGRDTCEGDSGGPLLAHKSCPPVVMGVTSSGHPCGFPGGAGLYTRVHHYVPWIESIVWP